MSWFGYIDPNAPLIDTQWTPDWPKRFNELAEQAKDPRLKAFYGAGQVSGDTPLNEVPFVALDFETTGLHPIDDEILTIGLVPFTPSRILCKDSAHWVVNPHRPLNEESVVIHGITDTEVKNAPDLNVILDQVLAALAGKVVVVHYKSIERQFLYQALLKRLGEGIEFPVVDTLDIEAAVQQRLCAGFWNWLKRKRRASVRLGRARARYGLPVYQPHHALTDALATAELLQAQLAYHYESDAKLSDIWQ
ncbi:3'-5' exonuclease DinG [Vibrio stylophorae]|uniref:3'-5' exonuclease DinG n=1 Tax=Vibrio stylophorae TaxID=659351 RepID=A0ABN8DUE9_9VIBR|nr:3'-5' exonuclease [Vibrio stylophorae]CAH0533550.1 3'-5' exonuclease DinG [Vibrio stylophorae]